MLVEGTALDSLFQENAAYVKLQTALVTKQLAFALPCNPLLSAFYTSSPLRTHDSQRTVVLYPSNPSLSVTQKKESNRVCTLSKVETSSCPLATDT